MKYVISHNGFCFSCKLLYFRRRYNVLYLYFHLPFAHGTLFMEIANSEINNEKITEF